MAVKHTDQSPTPPKARPRKDLNLSFPASEAFARLSPEERLQRIEEARVIFRTAFAGMTVDDIIAEKRREEAREN